MLGSISDCRKKILTNLFVRVKGFIFLICIQYAVSLINSMLSHLVRNAKQRNFRAIADVV